MSDFIVNPPATSCPAPTANTGASNTSQVTFDGTSLGAIGSVASGTNMNTLLTSLNSWASNTNTSIAYWDTQITAIQATVSATLTSIGNLDSDVIEDIHLGAATPTPYVNLNTATFPITGTTLTSALTGIDGAIGTIWTTVTGITGGGTLVGEGSWEKSIGNVGIDKSIYKAKVGQGGTRFEKLSDSGLSVTLDDGTAQAYGVVASRQQTTKAGLAATSDNYLYVDVTSKSLTAGYTLKSVAIGAAAPSQTDSEVSLWKITTDATTVTASVSIRELKQLDASDITGTLDVATLIGAGTITPAMLNLNAKVDYGGDYSGSYTTRSLVDKAYVDTAVSTASGYWTLSGLNLQYTAGRIQIGAGVIDATAVLTLNGKIRIVDGTQGVGKTLVSDANGVGTWTSYQPYITIKDEGSNVETSTGSINFVGSGVTAITDGSGNVTVTVTGSVTALNDLSNVSAAAPTNGDMLSYDSGASTWVSNTTIFNDAGNVRIGDVSAGPPTEKLLIYDSTGDNLLTLTGTAGTYLSVSTAGLTTQASQYKYTFTNGGGSPLGAGKVLTSDATGQATWEAAVSNTFLGLSDTPANYTGDALKVLRVNAGETAVEFATPSAGVPVGSTGDFQWNNAGAFAGASPLVTDGTTIGIGNTPQGIHLVRLDGDSSSCSRLLHMEHAVTGSAESYGVEINLSGSTSGVKYGWRAQINGGTDNEGFCVALETGGFPVNIASADVGLHAELGHTTRANYGLYIDTTSSNSQLNTGIYVDSSNAGAGLGYGIVVENGASIIGGTTPNVSAMFQIDSTTQGFLPPRMTTVQMNAIGTPATGLIVYDTTTNQWMGYQGTSWVILG